MNEHGTESALAMKWVVTDAGLQIQWTLTTPAELTVENASEEQGHPLAA